MRSLSYILPELLYLSIIRSSSSCTSYSAAPSTDHKVVVVLCGHASTRRGCRSTTTEKSSSRHHPGGCPSQGHPCSGHGGRGDESRSPASKRCDYSTVDPCHDGNGTLTETTTGQVGCARDLLLMGFRTNVSVRTTDVRDVGPLFS